MLTDPPDGKQFVGEGKATRKVNIRADGARQGVWVVRQALLAALPLLALDGHVLVFCPWESWPDFYDALPHARQRLLRPARRDGLPLRIHLRKLHVLRHHHRVQANTPRLRAPNEV